MVDLVSYYRGCDLFMSMSEHEGFGVPFVEAMHFGIPVVAWGMAASAGTVGQGGIVMPHRDRLEFALAAHRIFTDRALYESLVTSGHAWIEQFTPSAVESRIVEFIGLV